MSLRRPAAGLIAIGALALGSGCGDGGAEQPQGSSTRLATPTRQAALSVRRRGLGLPPTSRGSSAHAAGPRDWTVAKARRRLAGTKIRVEGRKIRVVGSTLVCWGAGRPLRTRGTPRWRRFNCIAPTFRGAAAGPDALFVLRPLGRRRFDISGAHFSRY
jgi:hypothetical protein